MNHSFRLQDDPRGNGPGLDSREKRVSLQEENH